MKKLIQFGCISLTLSVFMLNCKTETTLSYQDLEGGWWFVDSDSTYSEFFIRNDSVWSFGQAEGIALKKFRLEGDTICSLRRDGLVMSKAYIKFESPNLLVSTHHSGRVVKSHKLSVKVDPEKQFTTADTSSYLYTFWNRTEDWYNRTHK